jgi:hypothetical protein
MTAVTIDADTNLTAWRGWLRREHARLNRWHCAGQLSDPELRFADLDDDATVATYHRQGDTSVLTFRRSTIADVPFLGDQYRTSLARARLLQVLGHETAHQIQAELQGEQLTGDQDADHGHGYRMACARLGIGAARTCPAWLWD